MTTPSSSNGAAKPTADMEAASQATNTVLALDGWGALVVEEPHNGVNGVNGSEPTAPMEPPQAARTGTRPPFPQFRQVRQLQRLSQQWTSDRAQAWRSRMPHPKPAAAPPLLRTLAPAAAMTLAVLAALSFGNRMGLGRPKQPAPKTRSAAARRRLALSIDPSLKPARRHKRQRRQGRQQVMAAGLLLRR